ncbi:unnamed protein product [Phyllotreta striolata]|uniref:Sodium channel protein Nach n=1 Tax=Phyllotreta striolata TaxID=444603 RepID=A0A9N9XUG4_PHYSR|nr:unnamed protein product [Phyllotreta striolata]
MSIERIEYQGAFREFASNSSLTGFSHLKSNHWAERYIWYFIHLLSLSITIYLIIFGWNNFMTNPTVITVESIGSRHVDIKLPSISICNIHKISKKKAERYAQYLSSKSGVPIDEVLKNISLLGYLYEYNLPSKLDGIVEFQTFLEKYDSSKSGYFNTSERLYQLQPACEEVVKDCEWQGLNRSCSDIFITDFTTEGLCCVFNYVSSKNNERLSPIVVQNNYKPIPFRANDVMKFTIMSNESDIFFTSLSTAAPVKILVSHPKNFPDVPSGETSERIIDKSKEISLRISPIVTKTTPEVRKYSIDKRNCWFSDEVETMLGSYSFSNCIMECKIRSIVALCQCIPYNYVNVFEGGRSRYFQCTLADLTCLNSFSNKWRTIYPVNYQGFGLEREKQDSIRCVECIPSCSDTQYHVMYEGADIIINGTKTNFSIVRILQEKSIGVYNKQDAFYYWYDMLSMFGGLCSITMGISFISIFEIIYYFIWVAIKKKIENTKNQ